MRALAASAARHEVTREKLFYAKGQNAGFHDVRLIIDVSVGPRHAILETVLTTVVDYMYYCSKYLPGSDRCFVVVPMRGVGEFDSWLVERDNVEMNRMIQLLRGSGVDPGGPGVGWVFSQCDRPLARCLVDNLPVSSESFIRTSSVTGEGVPQLLRQCLGVGSESGT